MLNIARSSLARMTALASFSAALGCATAKVDDMSAEQHESAASYEKAAARASAAVGVRESRAAR